MTWGDYIQSEREEAAEQIRKEKEGEIKAISRKLDATTSQLDATTSQLDATTSQLNKTTKERDEYVDKYNNAMRIIREMELEK